MRSWIALVWYFYVVQNRALEKILVVLIAGMASVRPEIMR
jgi:hypothetical protein